MDKARRAVVLLSGGLDSTVNLFKARESYQVVLALTFDYGQRAAVREKERAQKLAGLAGVSHRVIELPWFRDFTYTSLVNRQSQVPVRDAVSIDDQTMSESSAKAVWVPNRNGIFLNIAAGFAEGLGASCVIPGFNAEEAMTFPDNSGEYLTATSQAFRYSTSNHVEAICLTTNLHKTDIVRLGRKLGVPFDLVWPCYFAEASPCGQCESCLRFHRAMREA